MLFVFTRFCYIYYVFTSFYTSQYTNHSHISWEMKQRNFYEPFKLLLKSFVANSQYFYCSETFISFFSVENFFTSYLCIHTEKCHHNRLLDYSLTFSFLPHSNRVDMKIYFLFVLFRHVFEDEKVRENIIPNDCQFFIRYMMIRNFFFFFSSEAKEKCYEIFFFSHTPKML